MSIRSLFSKEKCILSPHKPFLAQIINKVGLWTPSVCRHNDLKVERMTDGYSNLVMKINLGDQKFIAKSKNNEKKAYVFSEFEVPITKELQKNNYGPKIFYDDGNYSLEEFKEGGSLNSQQMNSHNIRMKVVEELARFTNSLSNYRGRLNWRKPQLSYLMSQGLTRLQQKHIDSLGVHGDRYIECIERAEYIMNTLNRHPKLVELMKRLDKESPLVINHNDAYANNIIYDETEDTITLIDYEYTANNSLGWDIAFMCLDSMIEYDSLNNRFVNDFSLITPDYELMDMAKSYTSNLRGIDGLPNHRSLSDMQKLVDDIKGMHLVSSLYWLNFYILRIGDPILKIDLANRMDQRIEQLLELMKIYA